MQIKKNDIRTPPKLLIDSPKNLLSALYNQLVMVALRLGSIAPDFEADTTAGRIKFHDWIGDSWAILFSHPADFTPVCTTELGEVARRADDFAARGVKLIGLSANDLNSHEKWVKDIEQYGGQTAGPTDVQFPIVSMSNSRLSTI